MTQATRPHAPSTTGRAVLDVLAGEPIADAAHRAGVEPANLADAVEVFQQAGHAALAQQAGRTDWSQVYIEFADWASAEQTAATHLAPLLHDAEANGTVTAWWFTSKHPCWRLRLRVQPETGVKADLGTVLDRLVTDGHLRRWWPGIYEPETAAFGGPASVTVAHELFATDSREVLNLATRNDVTLGRRELSVLLCAIMMRAARLEWYEQGDVWQRVIGEEQRSTLRDIPAGRLQAMARQLRALLLANTDPAGPVLSSGGPLEPVTGWADAFHHTGLALAEAVQQGTLDRGLRSVLALHVIFHWNRLGLSMRAQSALAWAARETILGS
ncbi:thiopeptide-type bacteriocin biosynthesis protein [Streptomyces sp. 8N616]|uniref:thiopeptide-type bacteriocin biosynthesis protein n=1 Tax=Streptomyces sp. 8N616 TaxID=3457414 RepID=UPI003FD3CE19